MLHMDPFWVMKLNFIFHTVAKWRWWEIEDLPLFWCTLTFHFLCGPFSMSTAVPELSVSWEPFHHLNPFLKRPLSSTRRHLVWLLLALNNNNLNNNNLNNLNRFIKLSDQLTWCSNSRLFQLAFYLRAQLRLTWKLWLRVWIAIRPAEVPAASAPSATNAASTVSSTRAVTCAYATIALWLSIMAEGQPAVKDCVPFAELLFVTSFEPTDLSSFNSIDTWKTNKKPFSSSSFSVYFFLQKSTNEMVFPSLTRCPSRFRWSLLPSTKVTGIRTFNSFSSNN
jgi:hypothetical protein